MKRSPELIHFSREHHPALVLAKRIQRAQDGDLDALLPSAAFLDELERHFAAEEAQFALQLGGLAQLASRFNAEHASLRALMHKLHAGDVTALPEFGLLLEAHVRFEERELFPALEADVDGETGFFNSLLNRQGKSPGSAGVAVEV
ncbi:hemerythrin domain-containing protein [Chitinilyticum piscinae]|uniref:Hemerythrin domain-containing protein n=1 Tax=Chitinilyticum piscinae TaxID=2866724 RepID=A0A8J7K2T0_9NEIS|nr:hemerythrin domain-containing protein [Chitinilyticum piscinae]MBE9610916.1 hemerythrin domain-containing protein [Chitinilyticum piscinae]